MLTAAAVAAEGEAAREEALTTARALAEQHRFQEAYDALRPHLGGSLDDAMAWEIAAEAGRAAFHSARYAEALDLLRSVVAARPVVLEPALYLGAVSFLLGDRDQSLAVLEAVLEAGTVDLYRAVTLPGERAFLADPRVRELLERHSRPLPVDLESGTCMGIALGQPRSAVVSALGARSIASGSIAARAGPRLIWVWSFDEDDTLGEVILHPRNLQRYTPYRVRVGDLAWDATPADALAELGSPQGTQRTDGTDLTLRWSVGTVGLDLVFTRPEGVGPAPARLDVVRLFRLPPAEGTEG
jgi:tetratricopeptide (TPR) repeat protein